MLKISLNNLLKLIEELDYLNIKEIIMENNSNKELEILKPNIIL